MGELTKSFIISMILLAGVSLASAYTPEQQTTIDGMRLSFQLGVAYQQAQQGQNIAEFNSLVDQYNAWIRAHFGEDANLLMPKINSVGVPPWGNTTGLQKLAGIEPRKPFNSSGDLSKFGKQEVYSQIKPGMSKENIEANAADWIMNNF
jgi:hypothetical protein